MNDITEYEPAPRVKHWLKFLSLLIGALLLWWFTTFVWPSVFLYEHDNGRLVKISRYGGEAYILTDSGWLLVAPRGK